MKDLYIIGAGGFGREVAWLVERINSVSPTWNIKGFIDDNTSILGGFEGGYPVVGDTEFLLQQTEEIWIICAVGNTKVRRDIVKKIEQNPVIRFATVIDPSVLLSERVTVGDGSIICAGSILTVDISIGKHVIINLDCTLGHDDIIADFVTIYPGVNVSGKCKIGDNSELGTGTKIIQGKTICENVIVGAGAVIVKDILESGTYVGVPVRKV